MKSFFKGCAIFFGLMTLGSFMDKEPIYTLIIIDFVCIYFGWVKGWNETKKEPQAVGLSENHKRSLIEEAVNRSNSSNNSNNNYKQQNFSTLNLTPISERFTYTQKEAIVTCLYIVTVNEEVSDETGIEYINKLSDFLNYQAFDEVKTINKCIEDTDFFIQIIRGFNSEQKLMFFRWLVEFIQRNKEIKKTELSIASNILLKINFKSEKSSNIIDALS